MRAERNPFYDSAAWRKCSKSFLESKMYICERCGQPATTAHHKIYLNTENIQNSRIALSWDNLEALCSECHNKEHGRFQSKDIDASQAVFDLNGNMLGVKSGEAAKEFAAAQAAIGRMFADSPPLLSH